MKTNFTKEKFMVLTNSENKIIAIIKCKKGTQDIAKKLNKAISEDYDADLVTLLNQDYFILNDFDYEFEFEAIIKVDSEEINETFSLTFTCVY